MTDILKQLDAATDDWFLLDDGKASDLYFQTSFWLDYFIKQKKGLFKRPSGGKKISELIRYDGNQAGFFSRGGNLDSTKREAITKVYFEWKSVYGNGTIIWQDTLENKGAEAYINLIDEEVTGAILSITDKKATSMYHGLEGDKENFTGFDSITNSSDTAVYGGYSANDIVSEDNTKVWTGKENTNSVTLSTNAIRNGKRACAYGQGKKKSADLMATTEENFDSLRAILEPMQRFTTADQKASRPVKVGFEGVHFEGTDIFPDRYCPDNKGYLINSYHVGFAFHKDALFLRTPWEKIQGTAGDKTMKILSYGNMICNNRRSIYKWDNLNNGS